MNCAVKLQIAHSRALNKAKKAEILFENKNSGEEYELRAEMHLAQRNIHLFLAKCWLDELFENIDDKMRNRFKMVFETKKYQTGLLLVKKIALLHILHSNVPHENTLELKELLNTQLKELERISSLDDIYKYTQNQFDEFLEKNKGNPLSAADCLILIILLLLGLYTAITAIVCILFKLCDIKEAHERLYKDCGITL